VAYEALTPDDVSLGFAALSAFRRQGHEVAAAFWFFQSDAERWRLMIVTPSAEQGVRDLYLQLIQDQVELDTGRIAFVTPDDRIAAAFMQHAPASPDRTVRVRGAVVGNVFVEDAWVYPLGPAVASLTTT